MVAQEFLFNESHSYPAKPLLTRRKQVLHGSSAVQQSLPSPFVAEQVGVPLLHAAR